MISPIILRISFIVLAIGTAMTIAGLLLTFFGKQNKKLYPMMIFGGIIISLIPFAVLLIMRFLM